MLKRMITAAALFGLAAAGQAQTVSLSLTSPQNGTTVAAGATINWTISFTVSQGDNAGLALLATDLRQAASNPAFLDIPYAGGVPAPMTNFSRPAGISNPGEGGNTTGYVGVQRGTAGQRNLIQIGGAQNNFGQTATPGSGIAQNATVTGGVGQGGSVTLASGSFQAPASAGSYTFLLTNSVANVLEQVNVPPDFSPALSATVDASGASFSFTVGGPNCGLCGDSNCDGAVTVSDIGYFVTAVAQGQAAWDALAGTTCDFICANDTNGDNGVTVGDIGLFVAVVTGSGSCLNP